MQKTILVLAPHVDDGETGCGGTIAKFAEQGANVIYVAFSTAIRSIPKGNSPGSTIAEVQEATNILGVSKLKIEDYRVRDFPRYRQEILEAMVMMDLEYSPDFVFLPSRDDTHQDHMVVCDEGFRAFKKHNILGYETLWNSSGFHPQVFIPISKGHLEKKCKAINCYMSQKTRQYGGLKLIRSLAHVRGASIREPYAEAFTCVRWLV